MLKFLKKLFKEKVKESQKKEPVESMVISAKPEERFSDIHISRKEQQPTIETNKDSICISINGVIAGFSNKLTSEIIKKPTPSESLKIPSEIILPQIKTGAVKITFGELKKFSPPGIFSTNYTYDNEIVYLPLKEIIPKISESHFKTESKKEQKIPDEIDDIFGGQKADNKVKPISAKKPETIESPQPKPQKPVSTEQPVQINTSVPKLEEPQNVIGLKLLTLLPYLSQDIVKEIQTLRLSESLINIPIKELEPLIKSGKVIYNWGKIFSWIFPLPQSTASNPDTPIEIPLKIITPLFLSKVTISIPKKAVTLNDTIPDIFTPTTAAGPKIEKVTPNRTAPETIQPIEEKAMPLQTPVENVQQPQLSSQTQPTIKFNLEKEVPKEHTIKNGVKSLNELFNKPGKTKWTPNEVIQCTLTLPGINGAMILLKEGLPVSYKLSDKLNPDVFAALLPQIFSRVSNFTSELKLGALTNLTFECNDTIVSACVSENIYFVVLGKRGESLPPCIQLQAIADELVKLNKN